MVFGLSLKRSSIQTRTFQIGGFEGLNFRRAKATQNIVKLLGGSRTLHLHDFVNFLSQNLNRSQKEASQDVPIFPLMVSILFELFGKNFKQVLLIKKENIIEDSYFNLFRFSLVCPS